LQKRCKKRLNKVLVESKKQIDPIEKHSVPWAIMRWLNMALMLDLI
jgi:hypothetical protein